MEPNISPSCLPKADIKLEHTSSLYTTFNSPHGRYRFLQLPFGLIKAHHIFQKKADETIDPPGVSDDIVINATTSLTMMQT